MDYLYGSPFRQEDIKASEGGGWEVAGYASTFGNVDLGGDVVMRGAFDATLASGRDVVFLLAHHTDHVLGVPKSLKADDKGLFGTFKISKTALGEDTHTLLRDGALKAFSIGYIPTLVEFDDAGTRLLKSVDLLEVSIVAIPMNDRAVVTRVKGAFTPDMSLAEHAGLLTQVTASFGERMTHLLGKLREDSHPLTATKRQELSTLLETFSGLDAVRSEAEQLLRIAPALEVPGDLKLRLQLARRLSQHRGHFEETAA